MQLSAQSYPVPAFSRTHVADTTACSKGLCCRADNSKGLADASCLNALGHTTWCYRPLVFAFRNEMELQRMYSHMLASKPDSKLLGCSGHLSAMVEVGEADMAVGASRALTGRLASTGAMSVCAGGSQGIPARSSSKALPPPAVGKKGKFVAIGPGHHVAVIYDSCNQQFMWGGGGGGGGKGV